MAGLMESIFGGGVKQLTEQRRLQQEKDMQAQLALDAKRGTPILEQIGGAFGQSFGEEAARNIFGDPEMEELKEGEEFLSNLLKTKKPDTVEFHKELGDWLYERGDLVGATKSYLTSSDLQDKSKQGAKKIFTLKVQNDFEYLNGLSQETYDAMKASKLFEDNELKTYERLILKPDDNNKKPTNSKNPKVVSGKDAGINNLPEYIPNEVKEKDTSLFKLATGISPENLPVETKDFFQRTFKDAFRPYE